MRNWTETNNNDSFVELLAERYKTRLKIPSDVQDQAWTLLKAWFCLGNHVKKFCLIPEQEVRDAKPDSAFIIATHDHSLDFMLCHEVLLRNDASYIGMIGSKSKRGVLVHWLSSKGIKDVSKVKIPIGNTFFKSKDKRPEIISAYIISEMLDFDN